MQGNPDLKNVYSYLLGYCVRSDFPNFVVCNFPLYQPHRELLSPEHSNSLLQLGIYFWRWNSCFFKLLEEILICFEEGLWMLCIYVALHLWKALHLCGCLVLHCFLKANSIIGTKEVQRVIMKVDSIYVCLLSC